LLTTSVATATTTPAQTFALSNAAPFTDFSNATSSSAAPTYNLVSALNGANVDAQTGNYSFTCATDRDGEIDFNISAAATLTMPQAGSTSCLLGNFFVYVRNTASSTAVLTVTATTSTFQPEGGASHTVLPNSSLIIFSDATSSTGNYHAILTPASFGGVNTKTSSYTATAADANKLIVANCSGACAITLPATPPNSGWTTQVISIGSTLATVGLNSLNFNGSATAPVLVSKETLSVFTDGTNYFGNVPASAGTGTVTSVTCGTGLTGGTITTTGTCAVGGAVGEILAGATPALTATPTLGASGMAGTLAMFPASGNFTTTWGSAATTSNTILGFAAVPVTGDTVTCTVSSTTCTLTDSGLPPFNPAVPGAIGGTTPAAGTFTTLTGKTSVTAGIVGTTAGLINLSGLTSGTATITAPAVAGTVTNPILFSNGIAVNTGSTASTSCPGISLYGSCSGLGFNYLSSGSGGIAIVAGSANVAEVMSAANAGFQLPTGSIYSWGSLAGAAGDTGISRGAAGIVDVGNGTNANTTGILKAAAYMSLGTKYTATGCSNGTTVGGATSGQFASGTTGTCTVVVTMGNTATAPNGWSCWANNLTTTTDLWAETATTTTTATIAGTSVTGDTINFGCMAY